MRIRLLCVGRTRTKYLDAALEDYVTRLAGTTRVMFEVVPASNITVETAALAKRLSPDECVVLLDERGALLSTPELATRIEQWQNDAAKSLTLVIGGAHGVGPALRQRADLVWSLSPLVFPHELVRLLVVEQLYRAYDILRGGKYHHD